MKKSIIYNTKQITIGELVYKYKSVIILFWIFFLNIILNLYLLNDANNLINTLACKNMYQCENILEFYHKKTKFSNLIIKYNVFVFIFMISCYDYLKKIFGNINFEAIYGLIYQSSSLWSKDLIITYIINHESEKNIEKLFENTTYKHIHVNMVFYFLSEIITLSFIIIPLLLTIIIGVFYSIEIISAKIIYFYDKYIKKIKINYIESKEITIDKII